MSSILDPFRQFGDPATFGMRMRNDCNQEKANIYLSRYCKNVLFETLNQIQKESIQGTDQWFVIYTAPNIDDFIKALNNYNLVIVNVIANFGVIVKLPSKQQTQLTTQTASL